MRPQDIAALFKKLGLEEPSRYHVFAGMWSEEGVEVDTPAKTRAREAADRLRGKRQACTCCSCYFDVGPPGCDGTNCHNCGGECG